MEPHLVEPPWPELLGSNQWEGLLQPLNLHLRQLILRCGDFTQATYDAFNSDEHSKYCGSSRYGKRSFFDKVAFDSPSDYEVASFIYATAKVGVPRAFLLHSLSREAWDRESNWIGYVAVSSDSASRASEKRDIFVAWRGTIRDLEWVNVLDTELVSIDSLLVLENKNKEDSNDDEIPKVMKGWFSLYTSDDPKSPFTKQSARDQVLAKIKELVTLHKDENLSITCVGHSLGASLATLNALDIVENGLSKVRDKPEFPVAVIVFGSPQVGNRAFVERVKEKKNLKVLHIRNKIDMIPHYPNKLLGYEYIGEELVVKTHKSPYLKDSKNPGDWHNLQGILHAVAGWNGKGKDFQLQVKRNLALVNKSSDFLKDECLIPGSWWVEKNKGMVVGEDGEWKLAPPSEDDIPVPECT